MRDAVLNTMQMNFTIVGGEGYERDGWMKEMIERAADRE